MGRGRPERILATTNQIKPPVVTIPPRIVMTMYGLLTAFSQASIASPRKIKSKGNLYFFVASTTSNE
jgi:hypothetical protein